MTYNDQMTKFRRFEMLEQLFAASDYTLHEYDLQKKINALNHGASSDVVRADLVLLEEHGLVYTKNVSGVIVGTLTRRGDDVRQHLSKSPIAASPGLI